MRRTWVYVDGVAYEKGTEPSARVAPDVMPDIAPYVSQIDGSLITSRSRLREHLKARGYVEIGNDSSLNATYKGMPDTAPQQRKELLVSQVNAMTQKQFDAARMKDLNRLRWETRGIPDPLKEL